MPGIDIDRPTRRKSSPPIGEIQDAPIKSKSKLYAGLVMGALTCIAVIIFIVLVA